jgi:hypothetical protein
LYADALPARDGSCHEIFGREISVAVIGPE